MTGGGLGAWLPDGSGFLVAGRDEAATAAAGQPRQFLGKLSLEDGTIAPLATAPQFRGTLLSPAGGWVAYSVAFSGDPAADGLWLLSLADGSQRRLDLYGAYRWRAEGRLLVIPLEPEAGGQRLVEVEAATGAIRPLTDPAVTALRIAAGDWALSPDGRQVAFVNAADRNLWVLTLNE
jgi:hypothetical protein